jgi:hypothetical protein
VLYLAACNLRVFGARIEAGLGEYSRETKSDGDRSTLIDCGAASR